MVDEKPNTGSELRHDVRSALGTGWLDSAKEAMKLLGALAVVASIFGGGQSALNKFTMGWFVGLIITCISATVVAFVVLEFSRLHKHVRLLRELVNSERYYESLLKDAYNERDKFQTAAQSLQMRLDAVLIASQIMRSQMPAPLEQETREP